MKLATQQFTAIRTMGILAVTAWLLRLTAAAILLQTLFFKFTAAPESVYIFTKVGENLGDVSGRG